MSPRRSSRISAARPAFSGWTLEERSALPCCPDRSWPARTQKGWRRRGARRPARSGFRLHGRAALGLSGFCLEVMAFSLAVDPVSSRGIPGFSSGKGSAPSLDRNGFFNQKNAAELLLEIRLRVMAEDILPGSQKPLDLGVCLGDEFNDQAAAGPAQETGDSLKRQVVGDCQVVRRAGPEPHRPARAPAGTSFPGSPSRGPVSGWSVHDQGEKVFFVFLPTFAVIQLDGDGVDVERNGRDSPPWPGG